MHHVRVQSILDPCEGFTFDGREINQSRVMGQMTGKCISSQIITVLPLGRVGVACASVLEIPMLYLALEGHSFIHFANLMIFLL